MASLSWRISPRTSTVIFFERSPLATAVVTSAMLRTCEVKLDAMEFTLSVKSFHVPATPRTSAWPPRLPSVPTSRTTHVHGNLARQVALGHGGRHFSNVTHLRSKVGRHRVHRVGQIFPRAADAG